MESNQSTPEKASSTGDSSSQKQEAFTHLAQGKRHLLVRDYFEAATSLAQACKLLAEQYGESANEVGDAYFCYGKALLELARSESGVLGDAIEGEHEDSNDDDDEEEEEGEEQAEEGEDKIENGKAEEEKDDTNAENQGSGEQDKKEDDKKEGDDNAESDDESNLKLAWEVLELAKLIFQRQAKGNTKISLMLAEVYLKLGEVSLEDENYAQAIEDIKSCLKIQTENLPEDDRYVAETFYQLGVAYSLNSDFDNAIDNFKNAVNVIEKRIKNLEMKKEAGSDCAEETKSDPFYSLDGEIKELKELLPEMQDKVSDMEDFKRETLKALCNNIGQRAVGQAADGASGSGSSATINQSSVEAKPVSNISHLVRKKRKPEETGEEKGTEAAIAPAKQAKTE